MDDSEFVAFQLRGIVLAQLDRPPSTRWPHAIARSCCPRNGSRSPVRRLPPPPLPPPSTVHLVGDPATRHVAPLTPGFPLSPVGGSARGRILTTTWFAGTGRRRGETRSAGCVRQSSRSRSW